MKLNFTIPLLTTLALSGLGGAILSLSTDNQHQVLGTRQACGPKPGWCDDNGCEGRNTPWNGMGACTAAYEGCPCKAVCNNSVNSCFKNGCNGPGSNGRCTAGRYNGCWCKTN